MAKMPFSQRKFDLVIFDLDGTLVNSEAMAERVFVSAINRTVDKEMTIEEISSRFRGQTNSYVYNSLAKQHGQAAIKELYEVMNVDYPNAIRTELLASAGAIEAIEALGKIPMCVASNGNQEYVQLSLDCTGLRKYFIDAVFTAEMVSTGKPAPDLFLYAAKQMGIPCERVVVIEDSLVGVEAGLTAGMTTVCYVGNHPETADLIDNKKVQVIQHMSEVIQVVFNDG